MEAVVKELRKDAQLGVFLAPDCNVSAIASQVVATDASHENGERDQGRRSHSVSSNDPSYSERFVDKLQDTVVKIDRAITEHISEHHMELLEQVGSVDGLQTQVSAVQSSVYQLKHSVHDLERMVQQQHDKLSVSIRKHRQVEKCNDIVRRLLRYHQLSERILSSPLAHAPHKPAGAAPTHTGNSEMVTLALAIREVESLVADPQFEELSVVRLGLASIRKIGHGIRADVRTNLRQGMQRLSQADVADALQILFYTGALTESVQSTVSDVIQDVERKCTDALAEDMLLSHSTTSGGEAVAQKTDVWKAIQDVFEVFRVHALQVWNLQRVLVKMIDPSTSKNYLDLVIDKDEPTLFATFWEVSCGILGELFSSTLSYRTAVKTVLLGSYPRMREEACRMLQDLRSMTAMKLDTDMVTNANVRGYQEMLNGIASSTHEQTQLLDAMSKLFELFMDRAFRRLSNPIQMMFPQSTNFHVSPPSRSDMQTLVRTMLSEIDQVGNDPVLLDGIMKQIRKAVTLFCSNAKRIAHSGKAASVPAANYGRTTTQAHNVSLLGVLHQLDESVDEFANRLSNAVPNHGADAFSLTAKLAKTIVDQELVPCREALRDLEYLILGQYLQGLCIVLENMLAKMHDESFGDRAGERGGAGGSRFMAEFSGAFMVVQEEHLKRLPSASFVTACLSDFVARLISVFLRHASLLRPLEESGKLRLANDMAQMELRLECVVQLRSLGAPYEELRAFRHMMFLDTNNVLRDSTIDKIRPSNVWHHLISRAPAELQLPHQRKQLSAAKYIDWLDTAVAAQTHQGKFTMRTLPLGYPCLKDKKLALQAEQEAWREIGKCLDAYVQRVNAVEGASFSPLYDVLQESGEILLAGYEVTLK
ncbi:TPA: hypothetical protein N0F65_004586 [Lagenidium giganteum]|uniref:Conserved oligomeric Golgi complex subunit 5 n=1 Tax=Lagenidium giganteum TaxID=4803 RepID=A0AAV2Z913_9STRA|nr:TPA: hypothetical protein N0F65_004586 [Lagenidium giganteum]